MARTGTPWVELIGRGAHRFSAQLLLFSVQRGLSRSGDRALAGVTAPRGVVSHDVWVPAARLEDGTAEESRVGPQGMWKHKVSLSFGAVVQDCLGETEAPAFS